jgi:hypothetical protein
VDSERSTAGSDHILTRPRHIVTNHLLHFLILDRSDPKKFQVLQLIAALLGWNDGKRQPSAEPLSIN